MIQLISREYYYNNVGIGVDFKKAYIHLDVDVPEKYSGELTFKKDALYLLLDEEFFIAYSLILNYIYVPVDYDISDILKRLLEDPVIRFQYWDLKKTSETVTNILNHFEIVFSGIYVPDELIKISDKGSWCLICERTGEKFSFELSDKNYFWESLPGFNRKLISYREKTIFPIKVEEILRKDKFIELVINGVFNKRL